MIASGTLILPEMEEAWLAERRNSLGASEVAAAIGQSEWATPIDLWQRKLGLAPEQEDSRRMRLGKFLEPFLASEYERETGRTLASVQTFYRHPDFEFLTATLDGQTACGKVVEFKTAAYGHGWGDTDDAVPDAYYLQVQQQLSVTGADEADLAVLIGNSDFRVHAIPRDDRLIKLITEHCLKFWACVQTRTPPDWGRMTAGSLAVLNPECFGEIALPADVAWRALRAESLAATIKGLEEEKEAYRLAVLAAMGNAQFAELPDGRRIKRYLKEVEARTYTVNAKASVRHYYQITKGAK